MPRAQAGELAMLTTDDGTSNPYKVRTADGFDYDDSARTILFRGNTYRPRRGQAVRAAYFRWR